ncbi:(d)CMP kinase [Patescibacteria group bacterium]
MKKLLQIAIDGPVSAGKSDIASGLAKELHIVYIYTGAMYRAFARICLDENITSESSPKIKKILQQFSVKLTPHEKNSKYPVNVLVHDKDITNKIFTPEVDRFVPRISTIKEVREHMVRLQKKISEGNSVVMEGRDIGKRVLPNAQLKIYLTASLQERAKRHYKQWVLKGIVDKTLDEAEKEVLERDRKDMSRLIDPLEKSTDAWELDTTNMSQPEVINTILGELQKRKLL